MNTYGSNGNLPYFYNTYEHPNGEDYWRQPCHGMGTVPNTALHNQGYDTAYYGSSEINPHAPCGIFYGSGNLIASASFQPSGMSHQGSNEGLPPLPPDPVPPEEPPSGRLQELESSPPPPLPPEPPPSLEVAGKALNNTAERWQGPWTRHNVGHATAVGSAADEADWVDGAPPLPPEQPPDEAQPPLPSAHENITDPILRSPCQQPDGPRFLPNNMGGFSSHESLSLAGGSHFGQWGVAPPPAPTHYSSTVPSYQEGYTDVPLTHGQQIHGGQNPQFPAWAPDIHYTPHAWGGHVQHSYDCMGMQQTSSDPWNAQYQRDSFGNDIAPEGPEPPDRKASVDLDIVDACKLFLTPGRSKRPQHICIILRGLPGSGKSSIAKKIRELEMDLGGEPPRLHALDDYFVTEVEKESEEIDARGHKRKRKDRGMEYCYESELEGPYLLSLSKAVKKTLEERRYKMVVMDAPNIQIEEFQDVWATAQRASYEVYVLQPLERDLEVCYSRNIHGRSREDIADMAAAWEDCPPLYTLLDVSKLIAGSDASADVKVLEGIREVNMEAGSDEDEPAEAPLDEGSEGLQLLRSNRWASLDDEQPKRIRVDRAMKRSKVGDGPPSAAASGARGKEGIGSTKSGPKKSVRWPDEVVHSAGFSIGGALRQQLETVYVLEGLGPQQESSEVLNRHISFAEQLKADKRSEQEAFRSILLGGLR
eukprot:jgi/Botrbrau1/1595/Bobra.0185s0014.2